jgi:hypothetical protein
VSQSLDLPDPVYDALAQAASASGTTPVGWIVAHLPPAQPTDNGSTASSSAKTMAELFAGHIGTISSEGKIDSSKSLSERFLEGLKAKRREGRL